MRIPFLLLTGMLLAHAVAFAQTQPVIHIRYARLLATYDFVQQLSDRYPDTRCRQVFRASRFYTPHYRELVRQMDTLRIDESYSFQGYPVGQKQPVMTLSLIERNLIGATSVADFKYRTFGIIPNADLFALAHILSEMAPVYDSLVYLPNRDTFRRQLKELGDFAQRADLAGFFNKGLAFYHTPWDLSVPIDIAVVPSIEAHGFGAHAFFNNAVTEVPLALPDRKVLISVLMHEMYHNIYDGESLAFKLAMQSWFDRNPSENSRYAYLLLNEALATALGNGYVYEQLNGTADSGDWYNVKYISMMAKQIYPLVKQYLSRDKPIDKAFVDRYIATYDQQFPGWTKELDNLLTYRYVLGDEPGDLDYFRDHYPHTRIRQSEMPLSRAALERMQAMPVTRVIVVSGNHAGKLQWVKAAFPELTGWQYRPQDEFIHIFELQDKTRLIVVCRHATPLAVLWEQHFKDKKIADDE